MVEALSSGVKPKTLNTTSYFSSNKERVKNKMEKEQLRVKLEGLKEYYAKDGHIAGTSYSYTENKIYDFGKVTRIKVAGLLREAHSYGILLGLQEALTLLETL